MDTPGILIDMCVAFANSLQKVCRSSLARALCFCLLMSRLFSLVLMLMLKALAKRSRRLGSTCDSVWPGLACTCVDLR